MPGPNLDLDAGPTVQPTNPMDAATNALGLKQKMNEVNLFQAGFQARQLAGKIISEAPDLMTGIETARKNPIVAAFAPETVMHSADLANSMLTYSGEVGKQGTDAFHNFALSLPAYVRDPSEATFNTLKENALSTVSPALRSNLAKNIDNFDRGLNTGLDADPKKALEQRVQRVIGYSNAIGASKEDVGTGVQGTTVTPALAPPGGAAPGTITPVGPEVTKGIPSQLVTGPFGAGGATTTQPFRDTARRGGAPGLGTVPNQLGGAGVGAGARTGTGSLPPGVGAPLTGPSQEQAAANTVAGTAAGEISKEMISRQETLPNQMKRLDIMSDTLKNFQAGGGASLRADVGKFLQGVRNAGLVKVSDEDINKVANGSLPDTQLFSAEVKPLVISALKEAAQGTGRVMRSEVDAFLDMMDVTTDPKALEGLLNQARYSLQVGYDQAQKYTEFKKLVAGKDSSVKGLEPSDFFSWYNKQFDPNALPKATGAGVNLGPVGGAKGTARHPKDIQDIINKVKQ